MSFPNAIVVSVELVLHMVLNKINKLN